MFNSKENTGLVLSSSGTSQGKAKQIIHSWEFNKKVMEAGFEGLKHLEPKPQKIANLLTAGALNGAFLFVHGISELFNAQAFPIGVEMNINTLNEIFNTHEIDTICCTPAYLAYLFTNGFLDKKKFIRHILFIGQMIDETLKADIQQLLPQVKIQTIAYSTTETGPIAYQCEYLASNHFHILTDYVKIKLMQNQEHQKHEGILLVTPIFSDNQALIDYNTNDLVEFIDHNCACGTPNKTIKLLGRYNESAKIELFPSKQYVTLIAQEFITAIQKVVKNIEKKDIQVCILKKNDTTIHLNIYISKKIEINKNEKIEKKIAEIPAIQALIKQNQLSKISITQLAVSEFKKNQFMKIPFFFRQF